MIRRKNGATLSLVAVVILIIIILGVGMIFLMKILGGGREVANTTDAGTLNVARMALKVSVPAPADFQDMAYPQGSGVINLLTYNRCVAKALIIAGNAARLNSGQATSNAQTIFSELNALGASLTAALAPMPLYNSLNNNQRMWGNNAVNPVNGAVAYMKVGGNTNVFFNTATIPGITVPPTQSQFKPINQLNVPTPGQYMPGYVPLTVAGIGTIYGTPVFPQTKPHLVSLGDFLTAQNQYGSAPPNSFRIDTSSLDSKSGAFGGAVACSIVGAVYAAGAGTGGTAGGGTVGGPLGPGFEFFAALPSGWIEFDNLPANQRPPKYDANNYDSNIFNNELALPGMGGGYTTGIMEAGGDAGKDSGTVIFSQDKGAVPAWLQWAGAVGSTPSGPPPAGRIFVGPISTDLRTAGGGPQPLTTTNPPNATQLKWLQVCKYTGDDCINQLSQLGLGGSCLASINAMEKTYVHPLPSYAQPIASPNFSQTDWAKATVLVDFETPTPPSNGAPNGRGNNNPEPVDLTTGAPVSGLGVFDFVKSGGMQPVPASPPNEFVPGPTASGNGLPLEAPGNIYQLEQMVMSPACQVQINDQIIVACQQIQPRTSKAQVMSMLQGPQLPMAPAGSSQNAKLFIYLPNRDLSQALTISTSPPPWYSNVSPDGNLAGAGCTQNTFYLDGTLVDSQFDQGVHDRPYVDIQPAGAQGGLYCIDHADWQPGSGANNCLGQMTFEEIGLGSATFSHIN